MRLPLGTRLGPYEITGSLGAGGMGEVYRARDTRLGRDVAIKVLLAGVAVDAARLARFEQEARAAAALNHPNITALYDIGSYTPAGSNQATESCPYLVTELLEGSTLRDRLSGGAVPVRVAVEWARQIALGLAAAHEKGIVHRDLKPENIFITADDRAKILDFGLAKLTEADPAAAGATAFPTTPKGTMVGMVLGTAGYMSPEQVRGVAADHRADLFAFGAVLYEVLSGRRAFGGETMMDVMMAAAREDVPPLASYRPDVPPALVRLVERCLEKDPAKRFQSTRDLAFALESVGGTPSVASPVLSAAPVVTHDRRGILGSRWPWPIAGVVLGAIVAVAGVALRPAPASLPSQPLTITLPLGFSMFRLPGVFSATPGFWNPSPDNRRLLGIQLLPDGRTAFVLNELANGSERLLGVTAGNVSILNSAWSPDSKSFAYWDATDGFLKRIAIDTGVVARLGLFRDVRSIGWGPDGLVFANLTGQGGQDLFHVSPNGGDAVEIAKGMRWPSVLPSGRVVAGSLEEPRGLVLFNPKTGEKHMLLPGVEPVGYVTGHVLYNKQEKLVAHRLDETAGTLVGEPVVIGDAAELHVSASDMLMSWVAVANEPGAILLGGGPLAWVNRQGQRLAVPGDVRPYGGATLAMRSDVEVATTVLGTGANGADVITVRLDTGATTRVFAQPSWDAQPRWSADGRRLLFRSNVSLMIAEVASASAPAVVVKSIPGLERVDDWSTDGRYVLVSAVTAEGRYDILQVDLQTGGTPTSFATTSATESFARFSPDGAYVAYVSDTTGPPEVYVQAFPAGTSRRVSLSGGTMPKWSRDGSRLYFFSPDGWIMEATVSRSRSDISFGTPHRAAPASGSDFVPSADGERFLVIEEASRRSLALVNWQYAVVEITGNRLSAVSYLRSARVP